MISVLFGKGLCSLGVLSVGVWDYRQEGVCTQDGVCRRCDAKCEQIEHDYRRKDGRGTKNTCDRCNKRAARRGGVADRWFGGPDGGGGDVGGGGE